MLEYCYRWARRLQAGRQPSLWFCLACLLILLVLSLWSPANEAPWLLGFLLGALWSSVFYLFLLGFSQPLLPPRADLSWWRRGLRRLACGVQRGLRYGVLLLILVALWLSAKLVRIGLSEGGI